MMTRGAHESHEIPSNRQDLNAHDAPFTVGAGAGLADGANSARSTVGESAAWPVSALVAEVGSSAFDVDGFSEIVPRGRRPAAALFILLLV